MPAGDGDAQSPAEVESSAESYMDSEVQQFKRRRGHARPNRTSRRKVDRAGPRRAQPDKPPQGSAERGQDTGIFSIVAAGSPLSSSVWSPTNKQMSIIYTYIYIYVYML